MDTNKGINILDLIKKELEEKGFNWNTVEKLLYIYKRSCELFNFDEKFYARGSYGSKSFDYNKVPDIKNVKDFAVICRGWSYLYANLVRNCFDFDNGVKDVQIREEEGGHMYVDVLTTDHKRLKFDPAEKGNDFMSASKGYKLDGVTYCDYYASREESNEKLDKMLEKVTYDYSASYNDYLAAVREELIKNKVICPGKEATIEAAHEIFKYILDTTNYKGLGLIEAKILILRSFNTILKDCQKHRLVLCDDEYINRTDASKTYFEVPNKGNEESYYLIKRENGEVKSEELDSEDVPVLRF